LSGKWTEKASKALSSFFVYFLPIISFLVLGAHFLRRGEVGLTYSLAACAFLLFFRPRWLKLILSIVLFAGGAVWARTAIEIASARMDEGQPYVRASIIIGAVMAVTLVSGFLIIRKIELGFSPEFLLPVLVFFLTLGLLSMAAWKKPSLIMMGRFFEGGIHLQVFLASIFGGFVALKLWDLKDHSKWRMRLWLLFSVLFYAQLVLGLIGYQIFLQTGKLHVPVPAMVIGGPIYRGEGFFMPILFLITIMLVGPAWCSHFCYFGAWDGLASSSKKKPEEKPKWFTTARAISLALVCGAAILFRSIGVPMGAATAAGLLFGGFSLFVIGWFSRRKGLMVNCTALCPLGLLADILGRISPFRIRIESKCVDCMLCFKSCRYGALSKEDVTKRRAGFTCSLCGDCLMTCPTTSIHYSFAGMQGAGVRFVFVLLTSALYSSFFAIAMV